MTVSLCRGKRCLTLSSLAAKLEILYSAIRSSQLTKDSMMRKLVLLVAVMSIFVGGTLRQQSQKDVAANDPNIRYIGRWDMTNPSAPRASWTYSLVTAKFRGTAINARLKGGGYYQVVVDGQPTRVIGPEEGRDVYQLAKELSKGDHVVEIVRRTREPGSLPSRSWASSWRRTASSSPCRRGASGGS